MAAAAATRVRSVTVSRALAVLIGGTYLVEHAYFIARGTWSLDFNLPFFKSQAVLEAHTAPAVWRELAGLGYPMDRQGEWAQLPKRFLKDAMVADVAGHVRSGHGAEDRRLACAQRRPAPRCNRNCAARRRSPRSPCR